jgi:hypothetical protein
VALRRGVVIGPLLRQLLAHAVVRAAQLSLDAAVQVEFETKI